MKLLKTVMSLLVLVAVASSGGWSLGKAKPKAVKKHPTTAVTTKSPGTQTVSGYKTKSGKVVKPYQRKTNVKPAATAGKTVHVKGYTTKSGKVVKGYTRKAPTKHK